MCQNLCMCFTSQKRAKKIKNLPVLTHLSHATSVPNETEHCLQQHFNLPNHVQISLLATSNLEPSKKEVSAKLSYSLTKLIQCKTVHKCWFSREGKEKDNVGKKREQICSNDLKQARACTQVDELHLEQSKGIWVQENLFPRNNNHLY